MKTTTSKRKDYQNTTLFLSIEELEEIKEQFDLILKKEKESISLKSKNYDLVITKGAENMLTLTFDCKTKE